MSQDRKKGGGRDDRIIALLNQLGDRMIRGEQSRRTLEDSVSKFDRLFSSLQKNTANGEEYFDDLTKKLSRAEEIENRLRERQDRLEREQRAQAEKLERAAALTLKMEEALAQQARLSRRLEKITQDRAHMLLKLERIEAAVLETREAMSSGTLLLGGHGGEEKISAPQLPADLADGRKKDTGGWRDRAVYQQVVGVAAMLALLLAGGWAASSLYLQKQTSKIVSIEEALPKTQTDGGMASAGEQSEPVNVASMDDAELLKRFSEDPDALAAALNEIEPGAAAAMPENLEKAAEDLTEKKTGGDSSITPAALTPQDRQQDKEQIKEQDKKDTTAAEPDVDKFIAAQKGEAALDMRILRDEKLPVVIKEIEQKAFEGIPEAQHDLAAIYTAGHGGVAIDYAQAAQWFREAAVNGVANARYNLGVLYHQGMGVEKNLGTAIGWYAAAAKMGHPEAQYNLGIAYIEGIGTDYNPGKAAMYFEQAARSGINEAAYNLGLILENGLLGNPSPREALYWYKKAADGGSPEAKTALENLARTMNISAAEIDTIVREMKKESPDSTSAAPPPAAAEEKKAAKKVKPEKASTAIRNEPAPEVQKVTVLPLFPESDDAIETVDNDSALVAQIQEQLMRLSLYPGPADGIGGPQTEDAIRAYQRKNDLKADGQPSQALLINLLSTELSEDVGSRIE